MGGYLRRILIAILIATGAARAAEVSPYLAFGTVPALGIYQIEHLRTYVNIDPDLTRGYQLISEFHFKPAIPYFEAVLRRKGASQRLRSEAETYLGYCWLNLRDPAKAVEHLKKAIDLYPGSEMAHFYLANEYYLDGDAAAVKRELIQAVTLRPTFVSALRMLAETYKDEGNLSQAIMRYEQIVETLPNSGYYRFQLYRAYMDGGRYKEARTDLQEMIRLEPKFPLNYYRLGDVELRLGDVEGATQAFAQVSRVGGRAFEHLAALGRARIHLAEDRLDEAEADLRQARALRPDHAEIQETLNQVARRKAEVRAGVVRRVVLGGGAVAVLALLAWAIAFGNRKRRVLAQIARFNQQSEQIYDQEELCESMLRFFTELSGRSQGLMLLFNRQSGTLVSGPALGFEERPLPGGSRGTSPWIQVVTGNEAARQVAKASRPSYPLASPETAGLFEEAFPSLVERLRDLGLDVLIPFREKSSFLGFMALGPVARGGGNLETDLLEPLVTNAAQALETLYLYESSMVDDLTGLYNKRFFKQQLATELKRADRYQQPCTVLTFDIDDFKKINDTYGHGQGDQVLRELGTIIRHAIREGIDTAARTGGEEFHVILPATSAERCETVADRIRASVEEHRFSGFEKPVRVTISVGYATYPEHASAERELVQKSDMAQYQAKRGGKNRVCGVDQIPSSEKSSDTKRQRGIPMLESRFDNLQIVDDQTGLYNYTYFSLRLREEIKRVARYQFPCSLAVVRVETELDDASRPLVLKQVGVVLKESLREGIDTPARLEGDDIGVILPETPVDRGLLFAERFAANLAKRTIHPLTEPLRVSVGVASYPECCTSDNQLLETALTAVRNARGTGGSGVGPGEPTPSHALRAPSLPSL